MATEVKSQSPADLLNTYQQAFIHREVMTGAAKFGIPTPWAEIQLWCEENLPAIDAKNFGSASAEVLAARDKLARQMEALKQKAIEAIKGGADPVDSPKHRDKTLRALRVAGL